MSKSQMGGWGRRRQTATRAGLTLPDRCATETGRWRLGLLMVRSMFGVAPHGYDPRCIDSEHRQRPLEHDNLDNRNNRPRIPIRGNLDKRPIQEPQSTPSARRTTPRTFSLRFFILYKAFRLLATMWFCKCLAGRWL